MDYSAQTKLKPQGLEGISDNQIDQHWELYEGYVQNFNVLSEKIAKDQADKELRLRAGFEFDGMALHELYFGNLSAGQSLDDSSALATRLGERWGSLKAWREDLVDVATTRGVGWAMLYHDPTSDQLFNWWVSDHELNHPASMNPILALDVWEHAYMVDHGADGRAAYVEAFLKNVHWEVVQDRFARSARGEIVKRW